MNIYRKISFIALALSALAVSGQLYAASDTPDSALSELQPERAVIHFADLGGIKNWRAVDDRTLEIEGRNGDWYRAELWSHCIGLRSANEIAFISEPNGDLDRFSSIYVGRGERCQFRTFKKIEMPNPE
jgi:hypothetical protein